MYQPRDKEMYWPLNKIRAHLAVRSCGNRPTPSLVFWPASAQALAVVPVHSEGSGLRSLWSSFGQSLCLASHSAMHTIDWKAYFRRSLCMPTSAEATLKETESLVLPGAYIHYTPPKMVLLARRECRLSILDLRGRSNSQRWDIFSPHFSSHTLFLVAAVHPTMPWVAYTAQGHIVINDYSVDKILLDAPLDQYWTNRFMLFHGNTLFVACKPPVGYCSIRYLTYIYSDMTKGFYVVTDYIHETYRSVISCDYITKFHIAPGDVHLIIEAHLKSSLGENDANRHHFFITINGMTGIATPTRTWLLCGFYDNIAGGQSPSPICVRTTKKLHEWRLRVYDFNNGEVLHDSFLDWPRAKQMVGIGGIYMSRIYIFVGFRLGEPGGGSVSMCYLSSKSGAVNTMSFEERICKFLPSSFSSLFFSDIGYIIARTDLGQPTLRWLKWTL